MLFFQSSASIAGTRVGSGKVTLSPGSLEIFKEYIRLKNPNYPSGFILSSDGKWANYHPCPYDLNQCRDANFKPTIEKCEDESNSKCRIFC